MLHKQGRSIEIFIVLIINNLVINIESKIFVVILGKIYCKLMANFLIFYFYK